jgi:hypothetical protein
MRRGTLAALVLLLTLIGITTPSQAAPSLSASLEPRSFAVDQEATLTITVLDGKGVIEELPEVEGLLFQRRGQSRQHQIINGSLSSSTSTIFQVQAVRPGTFTIPPITLTVDGQQLTTGEISVEVRPAAAGRQTPDSGTATQESGQLAFLRISPVKQQSYPGELLPVEINAYFRRGLRAGLNSHPRAGGDGFLLTLADQEPRQTEEVVNGAAYAVLTWTGSLSGIKEGEQPLRVTVGATVLIPAGGSRPGGSMGGDPFFGNDLMADFFNQRQMQEKKIQLVSPEIPLTVLPLPAEGKPEDFNGAIGRFTLEVKAQPTEVGPGDPITLTMTVRGTGNFDRVEPPAFSGNGEWKSYTPTTKFTPGAAPGQGSKVFEQAIIVKDPAITAIPPLSFSFFDPETRQYQTLHSAAIPLRVSGADNAGKDETLTAAGNGREQRLDDQEGGKRQENTSEPKEKGDTIANQPGRPVANALDLAPLHPEMGAFQRDMTPLFARPWFQAIVLVATLLLITAIVLKIRARQRAGDPKRLRQQEMTRRLDQQVRDIHAARDQGDARAFLALCRLTMQEHLGAHWRMEPGAITLADLHRRLAPDAGLIALFATAETSAYNARGGSLLTSREMAEYAQKLEDELRRLA